MKGMTPSAQQVLDDPATSDWLKEALRTAFERDPADALEECLLLAQLLDERLRLALDLDPPR